MMEKKVVETEESIWPIASEKKTIQSISGNSFKKRKELISNTLQRVYVWL